MVFKTYIILLSCPDIKYPVFSMGLRYSVKSIWAFASFYCILPWPVMVRKLSVAKGKKNFYQSHFSTPVRFLEIPVVCFPSRSFCLNEKFYDRILVWAWTLITVECCWQSSISKMHLFFYQSWMLEESPKILKRLA